MLAKAGSNAVVAAATESCWRRVQRRGRAWAAAVVATASASPWPTPQAVTAAGMVACWRRRQGGGGGMGGAGLAASAGSKWRWPQGRGGGEDAKVMAAGKGPWRQRGRGRRGGREGGGRVGVVVVVGMVRFVSSGKDVELMARGQVEERKKQRCNGLSGHQHRQSLQRQSPVMLPDLSVPQSPS